MRFKHANLSPERLAGRVRQGYLELSELPYRLRNRVEEVLRQPPAIDEPEPSEPSEPPEPQVNRGLVLSEMKVVDLRAFAKDAGIARYYDMNKDELIEAIEGLINGSENG